MRKKFFKRITVVLSFLLLISCDKDFNTLGADLVGDENFSYSIDEDVKIKAYSVPTGEVQTNNLPINPLGMYTNSVFGDVKANFVSQLGLGTAKPDFGTEIDMEEVVLYVPYFSHVKSTDSDGNKTYELDSIYGADPSNLTELSNKKFRLNIYENGYYLNSPNSEEVKFYSDFDGTINSYKKGIGPGNSSIQGGQRLNNSTDSKENDEFYFNSSEIKEYKRKWISGNFVYVDANGTQIGDQSDESLRVVENRLAPGIYLHLSKEFFKKRMMEDATADDLLNNNAFRSYMRGLYFQVEDTGNGKAMAMLNFNNASISIKYQSKTATTDANKSSKIYKLNLGTSGVGTTVSLQSTTKSVGYINALTNSANNLSNANDVNFGTADRLYLKGGVGSVVFMDLFGNEDVNSEGVSKQLQEYRDKNWLINDAYIECFIDQNTMATLSLDNKLVKRQTPLRLYLFDASNNKPITDFSLDNSTNTNPKLAKFIHGGIVSYDSNNKGFSYKIRVTQFLKNLLSENNNVNKNVRLGLCVAESIQQVLPCYYKNFKMLPDFQTSTVGATKKIDSFPVTSALSPLGTVIHGTTSTDAYVDKYGNVKSKKLRLVIHYTKPN